MQGADLLLQSRLVGKLKSRQSTCGVEGGGRKSSDIIPNNHNQHVEGPQRGSESSSIATAK